MSAKLAYIIDDDMHNTQVLCRFLGREGIECVTFTNPQDVEITEIPDIIFVDLKMPIMSGYSVLELLRSDTRLDGIPIVANTVHTNEMRNAQSAGFDGFISKPINKEKFPQQLAQVLSGEAVWDNYS